MRARTLASVPWEAYIVCVCVLCCENGPAKMFAAHVLRVRMQAGRQARTHACAQLYYDYPHQQIPYYIFIHKHKHIICCSVFVCHDTHTHTFEICVGARAEHLPNSGSGSNNCLARHAQTTCNATHRALFSTHMQHDDQQRRSSARKGFQIRSLTLVLQRIIQYFTQTAFHVHFSCRSRSIPAHI